MRKYILAAALLAALAHAETQQGGNTTVLTGTPVQFSSTLGFVNSLTFRVIPGYCNKTYIGTSAMTSSVTSGNLTGVIKILYPNCNGGLSDEYTVQSMTGNDGVDTSIFYLAGGDPILWQSNATGIVASLHMHTVEVGPVYATLSGGSYVQTPIGTSHQTASLVQINIVPGQAGKVQVGAGVGGYPVKYLYPNNGTVTGTITDKWEWYSVNPNGLNIGVWTVYPLVTSEAVLVTVWQHS